MKNVFLLIFKLHSLRQRWFTVWLLVPAGMTRELDADDEMHIFHILNSNLNC